MFDAVAELVRSSTASARCSSRSRTSTSPTAPRCCCSATSSRRRPDARVLVVLTYRSAERAPGHPLGGLLDGVERDRRLTRVPLQGLPEAEVARFFPADAAVGSDALRALHERTAGNPFFLRELIRLLAERGELHGDGGYAAHAGPGPRARGRWPPARAAGARDA